MQKGNSMLYIHNKVWKSINTCSTIWKYSTVLSDGYNRHPLILFSLAFIVTAFKRAESHHSGHSKGKSIWGDGISILSRVQIDSSHSETCCCVSVPSGIHGFRCKKLSCDVRNGQAGQWTGQRAEVSGLGWLWYCHTKDFTLTPL